MTKRQLRIAVCALVTFAAFTWGVWRLLEILGDPLIQSSRHATYADLERSGLVSAGWLPDYLPDSLRHLCEAHSVDFNTVSAVFALDGQGMVDFRAELTQRGFEPPIPGVMRPPYWQAPSQCPGQGFCDGSAQVVRAPERRRKSRDYFALDQGANRVCYWAARE